MAGDAKESKEIPRPQGDEAKRNSRKAGIGKEYIILWSLGAIPSSRGERKEGGE